MYKLKRLNKFKYTKIIFNLKIISFDKMSSPELKIVAITLDVDGIRFCETQSSTAAAEKRGKWYNRLVGRNKNCITPDLFINIFNYITKEKIDLFIITTQDEDERNTYLHSDYLPTQLREYSYSLYQRHVVKNVGQIKYTDLPKDSKNSGSALRLSVYVSDRTKAMWFEHKSDIDADFPMYKLILKKGQYHGGAISCHLLHRNFGHILIVAANLPNSSLINNIKEDEHDYYREYSNNVVQQGLLEIASAFWLNPEVPIDHMFLLGDFFSDLNLPDNTTIDAKSLLKYDFLSTLKNDALVLSNFKEGIDNKGPTFLPTFHMHRGRNCEESNTYDAKCFEQSYTVQRFGYPDRIMYADSDQGETVCKNYNRLEGGFMQQTDHAGVLGYFVIKFT